MKNFLSITEMKRDILAAQEAMDNGIDDSRWKPGETAVQALIRERDMYRDIVNAHNLCHDMHGKVGACEFAEGCAQEQRKIYGWAPHADNLAKQTFLLWIMLAVAVGGLLVFFLCI